MTYHVGRLGRLRQRRFAAGLLTGGLGGVGILLHATIGRVTVDTFDGTADVYPSWRAYVAIASAVLAGVGVVLGVMGWLVRSREQFLRLQIDGIAGSLSDRAAMADLLDEINAGDNWTRQEFRASIESWIVRQSIDPQPGDSAPASSVSEIYRAPLRAVGLLTPGDSGEALWKFARRVGPTDFASIVLPRAVQGQLIEEAVIVDGAGQERHGYRRLSLATAG